MNKEKLNNLLWIIGILVIIIILFWVVKSFRSTSISNVNERNISLDDIVAAQGACSNDYIPVCGTDNKTYQNDCQARERGATVGYSGICIDLIQIKSCPGGFAPVCGMNGVTYDDSCKMAAAGISLKYVGDCNIRSGVLLGATTCDNVAGFICGENKVTFQNECLATYHGIKMKQSGLCGK